jgi:hypothetical protein
LARLGRDLTFDLNPQSDPKRTNAAFDWWRVLEEVIRQASAEYVTVGWLTSTLPQHSFGIIMLSLGLLATTPVGSTVPGLILAVMAVQLICEPRRTCFPSFHHGATLAD